MILFWQPSSHHAFPRHIWDWSAGVLVHFPHAPLLLGTITLMPMLRAHATLAAALQGTPTLQPGLGATIDLNGETVC